MVNDNGSDEDDVAETETGTHEQESVHCVGGMDVDLNEDQYCNRDEGAYTGPDAHLEEPDDLYVAPTIENMADCSPEAGPCLPAAIIDTTQDAKKGAFVYPETVEVLRKFMDKYMGFIEITGITSSFSMSVAFRALSSVLHGMDTMQLMDITDHRLLCWRDAICEAITLGFHVDFLLNLVRNLARAVCGARTIHSMRSSLGSEEVKLAADALNFKQ
ncbi:hypothetical protein L3X38_036741 [Prunus dulcis]|uniref:Uncharacterized protein n=1 Tax=Prunus dulcis TaxID=3755 RepID=A0AAD4YQ13_PRUDU|nr:hypothetical protein L3X38_036741 [Prunus dulcis]